MNTITTVFNALSDPIRLEMVSRLSRGTTFSLGALSSDLGVTRQGARKHVWILEKAALISIHKKGRITEVQLNPNQLTVVKKFISKLEQQWDQRLLALREFVESKEAQK